ncbi:hypothetical protein BIW11_12943 [Tropilaelaps mercedesae]|uniref:Uncharacterized protein n=1 Tax=Tropilaelaps mercedesae TaxID=418985 RepID=A0A1V9X4H3_9ACAR|nr:hypothetical protein BIW11_12943 [Tropilaelaps mercedesae]
MSADVVSPLSYGIFSVADTVEMPFSCLSLLPFTGYLTGQSYPDVGFAHVCQFVRVTCITQTQYLFAEVTGLGGSQVPENLLSSSKRAAYLIWFT